jgi:arylsulfatase A-like enzyme
MTSTRRPNVLLILTDEHRFDAVGFNGNRIVQTPHLDALARQSVNFTAHTTSMPVCTPARASMLTGQYSRTHGAYHVGYTLPPATPTLATWLGAAGYACGFFGKSHLEPELSNFAANLSPTAPYYGFTRTGLSEDNLVGPYLDWIRREHPGWLAEAERQANESCQPELLARMKDPHRTVLHEAYTLKLPYELSQSRWIAGQTADYIREQREAGQPWFAVASFVPPHHPWAVPEPYASMYDPAQMPVSPRRPADFPWPFPLSHYNHLPGLPASEIQRSIALYYGLCTMLDDCIGRLLATVREQDDTIILFTSDHGDYNGDFGLVRKLGPLYDCLLRVPLLAHVPGTPSRTSHALTQHEDLAPTILELLGLPVPASVQGVSFAGTLRDGAPGRRRHAFHECRLGDSWVHGVRDERFKLLEYTPAGTVLTEPAADPREERNLIGHPAQAELQAALYRWQLDTRQFWPPKSFGW